MRSKRSILVVAITLLACLVLCGFGFIFLGRVARLVKQGSVARITRPDRDLQKAAKVAQTLLPQFLSRLSNPQPGDRFAVKVQFKTTVGPEYLWVKDPEKNGDSFKGKLDQNPIALPAKKGDIVSFGQADIYDWLIHRKDGSMAGGFTEIALQQKRS